MWTDPRPADDGDAMPAPPPAQMGPMVADLAEVDTSTLRSAFMARFDEVDEVHAYASRLRAEVDALADEIERRGEELPVAGSDGEWDVAPLVHPPGPLPGYQLRAAGGGDPVPAGHTVSAVGVVDGVVSEAVYDPARVQLLSVRGGLSAPVADACRERGWSRVPAGVDADVEVWVMDRAAVAAAHVQRAAAGGPHDLSVA